MALGVEGRILPGIGKNGKEILKECPSPWANLRDN